MQQALIDIFTKDLLEKWGIAGMIIIVLTWVVFWLLRRMLNDKSLTITELRAENKHYRDNFVLLWTKEGANSTSSGNSNTNNIIQP